MNGSFDNETLQLLDEVTVVRIETRRIKGATEHRTIIWVVVVDGEVFVRSVRGPRGRWYREIFTNPEGALRAGDRRIPGRAVAATDDPTVEAVSDAYRSKYGRSSPGSTRAMLSPEPLPTTLKLLPA